MVGIALWKTPIISFWFSLRQLQGAIFIFRVTEVFTPAAFEDIVPMFSIAFRYERTKSFRDGEIERSQ